MPSQIQIDRTYISPIRRKILIDHIDGPLPVPGQSDPKRMRDIVMLLHFGLLRDADQMKVKTLRPKNTVLSERGRALVGKILGEYADALARAESAGFELHTTRTVALLLKRRRQKIETSQALKG